jgi:hypothetical protein
VRFHTTRLQAQGLAVNDIELRIDLQALPIGGALTTTDLIGNSVRRARLDVRADQGRGSAEDGIALTPSLDSTP